MQKIEGERGTALVTGAAGFLGNALCRRLLANGWEVLGLVRDGESTLQGVRLFTSVAALKDAPVSPRCVFHCAAYIPYGQMDKPDAALREVNVTLVERLCQLFPTARHILASSVSVYGNVSGCITENTPPNKPNAYGQSKAEAEAIVARLQSYAALRFSSLWGLGMKPVGFLPLLLRQARSGGPLGLWGGGTRTQDYLHVDDAVGWCLAAAAAETNGHFLAVNGQAYANRFVALCVVAHFAKKSVPISVVFQGADPSPSVYYDASLSRELLKFAPQNTLEEHLPAWLDNYILTL